MSTHEMYVGDWLTWVNMRKVPHIEYDTYTHEVNEYHHQEDQIAHHDHDCQNVHFLQNNFTI